jgi:RND family efflux transporter MFP subunit
MQPPNSKPRILLVLFVLGLAVFDASCSKRSEAQDSENATDKSSAVTVVPVAEAVRSNLSSEITLTGEFIPYQEVDVMAKVAGYVRAIKVDIGDRVHEGQVLAQLEVPEMQNDMTRAAAAVEAADAEIVTARDEVTRAKSTHEMTHLSFTRIQDVAKREPGLVPQQEVDEAHSKDLVAEAEMSAAQSKLESAGRKSAMSKAEQARWGTLQNYTIIPAPFTGVVTKRYANTGSMIQAGTASQTQAMPVVRVAQNNVLRLILPVPESAVPSVHIGEPVQVSVVSLGKTFPGRVTRFANEVKTSTRTMDTEVDVPNSSLVLVPGMYAEVRLQLQQSKGALAVPLDAVDESTGAPQVYAVRDSVIRVVPVHTGLRTAQLQEIRSGVRDGDLVVIGSHAGLQDGQRVKSKLVSLDDTGSGKKQGS